MNNDSPQSKDSSSSADVLRQVLRENQYCDETLLVQQLISDSGISIAMRESIVEKAEELVVAVRDNSDPVLMESFLAQYGLSTDEGVALMCLAEALLRVPDHETVDTLIHDKIAPADWGKHLGQSSSSLVNASTWALMLTGSIITDEPEGIVGTLRGAVKRLGEPVVRTAVNQAIRELGNQFVLGEDILKAIDNSQTAIDQGYTYSYDMLGEAALTDADARRYHLSYSEAIATLGKHCKFDTVAENPGISVKLSALYPRYEYRQREKVMVELVSRTRSLAMLAKSANMGFNIDAEEADRLDLSLDVIEKVLSAPGLADWDGFGIVVQAYSKRAGYAIDWLYDMAIRLDRKIMIRLVKGAYWDTEIKRAQVEGFVDFPVYTRKVNTDVSYICNAEKLLQKTDRIYPQFATHNAHSVAAVYQLAESILQGDHSGYEFQRLHGMGESLHRLFHEKYATRCRIYAPVGAHEDLLAYLVRRLLENGANSSFVNQLVDEDIAPSVIASDPFSEVEVQLLEKGSGDERPLSHPEIQLPSALFEPARLNSAGFDLNDPISVNALETARQQFRDKQWYCAPMQPGYKQTANSSTPDTVAVINPANGDTTGFTAYANEEDVENAFVQADNAFESWTNHPIEKRAEILLACADLYESHTAELVELTCREAGKTIDDSIGEIREAVDFLRYYAAQAQSLLATDTESQWQARGTFICISPWNFPLAIFTGQIAAALASGNCVIAKPAEQTSLIAARAVAMMHEAGIPEGALQLLPGEGSTVGSALVSHPKVAGVCFTGSTATAMLINRTLAKTAAADVPLIAETGGINAMLVDSTALPEQAVQDIVDSAFKSAGQRCSALRLVCIQSDVYERMTDMLVGAMDMLNIDNPEHHSTDIGPVIDQAAMDNINHHCISLTDSGALVHESAVPENVLSKGHFVKPGLFKIDSIEALDSEIFGPVLHIYRFEADEIEAVLDAINKKGYGLTFGLHTRVDERVQQISDSVSVGNLYINRNQIGAAVGSQPFGGHGLSGTGPKAGGPHYLLRFVKHADQQSVSLQNTAILPATESSADSDNTESLQSLLLDLHKRTAGKQQLSSNNSELFNQLLGNTTFIDAFPEFTQAALANDLLSLGRALDLHNHVTIDLPGPTGESNRLSMLPAGNFLILDVAASEMVPQVLSLLSVGNGVLVTGKDATANCQALIQALSQCQQQTDHSHALAAIEMSVRPAELTHLTSLEGVFATKNGEESELRLIREALAAREGTIIPLITSAWDLATMIREQSLCIDTTAAGGNASLLARTV